MSGDTAPATTIRAYWGREPVGMVQQVRIAAELPPGAKGFAVTNLVLDASRINREAFSQRLVPLGICVEEGGREVRAYRGCLLHSGSVEERDGRNGRVLVVQDGVFTCGDVEATGPYASAEDEANALRQALHPFAMLAHDPAVEGAPPGAIATLSVDGTVIGGVEASALMDARKIFDRKPGWR